MHVVQINYAFDATLTDPDALLDRYSTLTGWSDAIVEAGVTRATVVQRFGRDATIRRRGVEYVFRQGGPAQAGPWTWLRRLHAEVGALAPDVAHVNGLVFPLQTWLLRRALPEGAALVVQDHASLAPPSERRGPWPAVRRRAMRAADGFLFAAPGQEESWRTRGLIAGRQSVHHVMEASTTMRAVPRDEARQESRVDGAPAVLWVGRLNAIKHPLTVLDGFSMSLAQLPDATLTMIYSEEEQVASVRARVQASAALGARVRLVGRVPHDQLPAFYSAADVFVLGSRHEGSGYALLEAAGCGLVPVVTDIPAFRAITNGGSIGALWRPGDTRGFAAALVETWHADLADHRRRLLEHFDRALSWPALGRRAVCVYDEIVSARRAYLARSASA